LGIGENFGVTLDGALYSKVGKIGNCDITTDGALDIDLITNADKTFAIPFNQIFNKNKGTYTTSAYITDTS
jgi:hypothetical protein